MEKTQTRGRVPVALMRQLIELIVESGADGTDALAALQAAEAMLPTLQLDPKPMAIGGYGKVEALFSDSERRCL